MSWKVVPENEPEVARTLEAIAARNRRKVFFKTMSGKLLPGTEKPIGKSKKRCSACQSTASVDKWEIRYSSKAGQGGSIDRLDRRCRSMFVLSYDEGLPIYEAQQNG